MECNRELPFNVKDRIQTLSCTEIDTGYILLSRTAKQHITMLNVDFPGTIHHISVITFTIPADEWSTLHTVDITIQSPFCAGTTSVVCYIPFALASSIARKRRIA